MPRYDAAWMYGVPSTGWPQKTLRDLPPKVLPLELASELQLPLGAIAGPPSLGAPSSARVFSLFNPSIVAAPAGLCERCAYVASVRADPLHQYVQSYWPAGTAD